MPKNEKSEIYHNIYVDLQEGRYPNSNIIDDYYYYRGNDNHSLLEEDFYIPRDDKSLTSKTKDAGILVGAAIGAASTYTANATIAFPLTIIAQMGVTAVYVAARVSFAGKRGLQDTAEFIRNSVNWMLGDKDAFDNIGRMHKISSDIQKEMTKIGNIYDHSHDENFKKMYSTYMVEYDTAQKNDLNDLEKRKIQEKFLNNLCADKTKEFYQQNKETLTNALQYIKNYNSTAYLAAENYRRSETNIKLTNALNNVKNIVNKPLKKAIKLGNQLANESIEAGKRLTKVKTVKLVRDRSNSNRSIDF
jgi:hypothetical protein